MPQATKADDLKTLQTRTFYGKEKKSLAYVIAIMNMILHGIEAPNVIHANTLADNISDIQDRDRYDVILANPPFGGKERKEVQQNFPVRTGETAFLFLQHFIKTLKAGGRAAIVIKNTFLSNTDNASTSIRKLRWTAATCIRCWTCPAALSRARASRPWCCSSRRARRRARSGSISWTRGGAWARPMR